MSASDVVYVDGYPGESRWIDQPACRRRYEAAIGGCPARHQGQSHLCLRIVDDPLSAGRDSGAAASEFGQVASCVRAMKPVVDACRRRHGQAPVWWAIAIIAAEAMLDRCGRIPPARPKVRRANRSLATTLWLWSMSTAHGLWHPPLSEACFNRQRAVAVVLGIAVMILLGHGRW